MNHDKDNSIKIKKQTNKQTVNYFSKTLQAPNHLYKNYNKCEVFLRTCRS